MTLAELSELRDRGGDTDTTNTRMKESEKLIYCTGKQHMKKTYLKSNSAKYSVSHEADAILTRLSERSIVRIRGRK